MAIGMEPGSATRRLSPAQPVTAAVYESLRESISTGTLMPGTRLIQSEVAERLGVSRLPVHEALQQLRREGFVTETGRRGLVVSAPDPAFLLQLFELRAALDQAAGQAAARARKPSDETRALAILERGRKGLAIRSLTAIASADSAFHNLIYQIAGNPLIAATAQGNWHHVRGAFLMLVDVTPELAIFWEDHTAIWRAVMDGDAARAGELSWDHSIRSGLSYSAELRRRAETPDEAASLVLRQAKER
jgi:DNA-binding GntR family transcriptional regulator